MKAIVYTSELVSVDGNASEVLETIVATSQVNNARAGVTGGLIHRAGRVVQALEGPGDIVDGLFEKICKDDRHTRVDVLCKEETYSRHFPDWAMKSVDVADDSVFSEETLKNIYDLFTKHMQYRGDLFFDLLRSTLADAAMVREINTTIR